MLKEHSDYRRIVAERLRAEFSVEPGLGPSRWSKVRTEEPVGPIEVQPNQDLLLPGRHFAKLFQPCGRLA